jgi:hypothetical protein
MNTIEKLYHYQPETLALTSKLVTTAPQSIEAHEHRTGIVNHEPLIVILDSLLRFAKAVEQRGQPIGNDQVLGTAYLRALEAVEELLDGPGAVCLEGNQYQDSKSNGVCSSIAQACRQHANQ